MTEFVDYFTKQRQARSFDQCVSLGIATGPKIDIEYKKIDPSVLSACLRYSQIFNVHDHSVKLSGAEDLTPMSKAFLSAMDQGGVDVEAFQYRFETESYFVVPSAPTGHHTDGQSSLVGYRKNARRNAQYTQIVLSNICSPAGVDPQAILQHCPPEHDRGFFYASVLSYVNFPSSFSATLQESQEWTSTDRVAAFIKDVTQVAQELIGSEAAHVFSTDSHLVGFSHGALHAFTCKGVAPELSAKNPGVVERKRILATIAPL